MLILDFFRKTLEGSRAFLSKINLGVASETIPGVFLSDTSETSLGIRLEIYF